MIGAILRAQLLSMRWGGRRGAVFSAVTGAIWYAFWSMLAYGVYTLARGASADQVRIGLPAGLLLVCIYWQVVPVISGSMGSALDLRKLLVYPAPHGRLFLVEVLLRAATGAEMLLVLLGGFVGLIGNGTARLAAALLLFVAFNLLLAAGLRSLVERLLSRRRVREVMFLLLLLAATAPRLLILSGDVKSPESLDRFAAPIQSIFAPWGAAGVAALGPAPGLAFLILASWTGLAAWFGRAQFERSLRFDFSAAESGSANVVVKDKVRGLWYWVSLLLRDPLAAIVEKELRSLARAPRFRIIFVMGFSFGLMIWLPFVLGGKSERSDTIGQNFLTVVCVYALTLLGQVSYWNCFGFDRSATQIYLAAPQPIRLVLIGKNIASLVFVYADVLVLTALSLLLRAVSSAGKVIETLLVVSVCALYMLAFGNISSVRYPRPMQPGRVGSGGTTGRLQALIFIFYPLALLPVFLAYLARYAFDSEAAFLAVLTLAAILGAVLYWQALDSAVETIGTDRERMLAELSRGEGPIVE
jgi:ABC-2 type transport system permease protein